MNAPEPARRPVLALLVAALLPTAAVAWTFAPLRVRAHVVDLADGALLATDRWHGFGDGRAEWMLETARGGVRQPLAWVSLGLDHALEPGSAARLHDTNVALHGLAVALVGALVFLLLRRTGAARLWRIGAPLAAALAAAAWGLHPLRTETVALLSARGDLLATVFGLVAACAWTVAIGGPGLRRIPLALGVVASVAAALSSPGALGFVIGWWALGRWLASAAPGSRASDGDLGRPLAALATAPVLAFVASWAVRPAGPPTSVSASAASLGHSLLATLWDTVWPEGLHPFRDAPPEFPSSVPAAWWVQSAIVGLVAWRAVRGARRRTGRHLALVSCLAAAAVAWAIGRESAGADRFSHIATIPLFVAAGVWLGDGAGCCLAFFGAPIVALAAVLPGWATRHLVPAWADDTALATHVLAADPANDRVAGHLAEAALRRGSPAEAEARALRSIRVGGARPRAEVALALVALERGDLAAAEAGLMRAVAAAPEVAAAHLHLGSLQLRRGRLDDAVRTLETAARLDAESAATWYVLGRARVARGDRPGAADAFRRALDLAPDDGRVREELDRLR